MYTTTTFQEGVSTVELHTIKSKSEIGESLYIEKENSIEKETFPSFIWINEFISVGGSCVYNRENDRPPNDIDIIVRAESSGSDLIVTLDPSLRLKIDRIMSARFGVNDTQWIGCQHGPNWKYQPLYDLALIPRKNIDLVEMDEPEFADEFYKEKDKSESMQIQKQFQVFPISKKEDERIVCGIVYIPDKVDLQGDKASAEEIQKAAWSFMEKGGVFRFNHKDKNIKATTLESFIAPVDYVIQDNKGMPVIVRKGSWVLTARVNDPEIWDKIKLGKIVGYSMAGKSKVRRDY